MVASLDRVLAFDSVFRPPLDMRGAAATPTEVLIEIQVSNFINDFFFADRDDNKKMTAKTTSPEKSPNGNAQKVASSGRKQTGTVAPPPAPPPMTTKTTTTTTTITMQRWPTFPPPSPSKGISHNMNPPCSSHCISISNSNSNSESGANSNSNSNGNGNGNSNASPFRLVVKPASKPPKPPLEGTARLTRSVSDTSLLKKKRSGSRSRRNNKVSVASSNNTSLWSMLITILFFGMMLLQGMLSVGHNPHEVKLGGIADLDTAKFAFARRLQKFEIPPSSQILMRQTGIKAKARS